jgi:hypothetical protein
LAGGTLGAILVVSSLPKNSVGKTKSALLIIGMLGGLGGLIGATVGQAASPVNIVQIEGKDDVEINAILEDLRPMARVHDAP